MKVLIADDDSATARAMQRIFEGAGHRASTARDGVEALQALAAGLPDLLVLDLMMPNLDGWELLRQVKSDPATESLPVAIFSALDDPIAKSMAVGMGANDFWQKGPTTIDEIINRAGQLVPMDALLRAG